VGHPLILITGKAKAISMKKAGVYFYILLLLPLLSGCSDIGSKSASPVWIYGATAILSLLLLVIYCLAVSNKDTWLLLLFSSVLLINIGYFSLSISQNLCEALLANRIAYLGSVFLPMLMLMSILKVAGYRRRKWLSCLLLALSFFVFLVAASPGYLNIYYESVSFEKIGGVSVLHKVYGPWHRLYLYYLFGHFAAMLGVILYAHKKKQLESLTYTVILLSAVFVNLGVWLIEQMVSINFEILSVSYIISELFLLGAYLITAENKQLKERIAQKEIPNQAPAAPAVQTSDIRLPAEAPAAPALSVSEEQAELFLSGLAELTPTERTVYEAYIAGAGTKDIMQNLSIKENTLKYHNKNLYGKLGVSSRKQLTEIHRQLKAARRL